MLRGGGEQTWFRGPAATERVHLNFGKASGERETWWARKTPKVKGGELGALPLPSFSTNCTRRPYPYHHKGQYIPYPTVYSTFTVHLSGKGTLLGARARTRFVTG